MRARWTFPLLIAGFAGCLLPSYGVDPTDVDPDAVAGSAGTTSSTSGGSGAGSSGASSAGGSDGDAGAGTSMMTDAGAPNLPGGCSGTQKDCAGQCVDVDEVEYGCTATSCNQSECPAGGETFACEAGACVIATCATGQKKCDGRCVSLNDPTYGCGAETCDDEPCPDPNGGTLICDGTVCRAGECTGATKACGPKCVPFDAANGCADPGSCAACSNNEVCTGTPTVCGCVPDDAEACRGKACGKSTNNCGDMVDCTDTCAAPAKCGGGTAGPNSCGYDVPRGPSNGCGKTAPSGNSTSYTIRAVTVSGVSPSYINQYPAAASAAPYNWINRNYFIRLPANYDKSRGYPVVLQGGGCGASDGQAGKSGGFATLAAGQDVAIQVGLSYMHGGTQGACFQDDTAQTPEVAYFDAVWADLQSNYCIDKTKVFADGWTSGGFEATLFGCARAGTVRATASAPTLHRLDRPACAVAPVASMMINRADDTTWPTSGPTGAAAQRDDVLLRNGCVGTATVPWNIQYPNCVMYTGCPAAYPVVWCELPAGSPVDGGDYSKLGFWKFFSDLPAPP